MAANQRDEAEKQRIIEHIFLPPRLPSSEDTESDISLVAIALEALISLRDLILPGSIPAALSNAIAVIDRLQKINSFEDGKADELALRKILLSLPLGQMLALKVHAQNAGVLISRQADTLVFEAFELSPANESILGTKGRLDRTSPGMAVSLSTDVLAQDDCASAVAMTLSTMCQQKAPGMQPTSRKAGASHEEERDTASPAAITELFFGYLRGIESRSLTAESQINKHTRDEVLWDEAKIPWRRSSMWLLIRVSLQLVLSRSPSGSRDLYKEVMVYIMSFVLWTTPSLSSDLMFCMSAKVSRRVQKLRGVAPTLPASVRASVDYVLRETTDELSARWTTIQNRDQRDLKLSSLAELNFETDTRVSLPEFDRYLKALRSRQRNGAPSSFAPSSQLLHHSSSHLPPLPSRNSEDQYYATANLRQFEQWISNYLDQWLALHARDDACQQLHALTEKYHSLAEGHYSQNPEMQSVMILTTYELWVACDRMAVKMCPLLAEFDPDISTDVLENLLLPFRAQMQRLIGVEKYLRSRQRVATTSADQIYSMGTQGFASKFYYQSDKHQKLLATIERDAGKAREEKAKEFQRIKAEYHRLQTLHGEAECEYTTKVVDTWCDPPETEQVHSSSCRKCSLARQRDNLSIKVHEWPLPSDPARARVVVFELQIPLWLGHWRDTRAYFLQNVLKGKRPPLRPSASYLLSTNDPHLTNDHFKRESSHRINLLSKTKPCVNTHYKSKAIADLSESDVCQPNGLRYNYYDSTSTTNMGKFTYAETIAQACTYKLSRSALQSFAFRPTSAPDGPSPNSVMARQDKCPADMAIDEYKELSTISLGRHIQWANIMLQLAMPGVDFRKSDTTLMFLQCINQAGPSRGTEVVRESHLFPSIGGNTECLVAYLSNAFQRVKENWESAQALHTFITIATRLLSLVNSASSRDSCLKFLATTREVAMKWLLALREKAYAAEGQDERTSFVLKSVEVALICVSTFDVEDDCLVGVLQENASILLQCSIVIQEGEHSHVKGISHDKSLLRMRHQRLLHRMYRSLAQQNLHKHLDLAVGELWSGYNPGSNGWRVVSDTADHWLTTETATTALFPSMNVHFDLLSGTLLVNGLPLDQPPRNYRQCPMYSTLFRHAAVEVMPCMAPGFDFSTKRSFGSGYAVQLGLKDGQLLVRAQKGSETFEVLPARLFGEFPSHFQDDYVHWLDQSKNVVQFRLKSDPWNTSSPAIWTLSAVPGIYKWQLEKEESTVAGISSETSQHIASILEPLAEPRAIHSIVQKSGPEQKLHVDVPTLHIGFLLPPRSSMLESREYRSMIVDDDQDVGTLVGLKSKLVLKPASTHGPHFGNRMLLVPESHSISYGRKDGHVIVTVSKAQISKVHAVTIDRALGRLVNNGDTGLHLAYLHALTSFCLVDPLTRKTGTEQALSIMRGAAINSLDRFSEDHVRSLKLLADLSPERTFYPLNLRSMQVVQWDHGLSYLSQHGHFAQAAEDLLQRARRAAVFFPETQAELRQVTLSLPDPHLHERDNIRSATFRVSGFGAEDHTSRCDVEYKARDRDAHSPRSAHVTDMASFMFRDGDERSLAAVSADQLWRAACEYPRVDGPSCLNNLQQVTKYSAGLLSSGDEQVMKRFAALHRWLGSHDARAHKFSIMIWLSTIAAGSKLDRSILQVIGMTFKAPQLARMSPPEIDAFSPQLGFNCDSYKVRRIVTSNCSWRWTRDIVDESDENFSVSFELIYTMGSQCAIEFSPDRWLLVQQVLDAVRLLAPQAWKALPDAVEYLPGALAGSFPRVRILREEGANLLLESLADHVCAHGLHGLHISRQPAAIRKAVRRYIATFELATDEVAAVEDSVFWTEATSAPLLLLRGFIAAGVLAFIFGQKRWRVNYGLTTAPRTPPTKLAVPYRAKDMPSPRSEFSHPDVVLFLTSLSYYYGGLDDDDLSNALSHVLNSDQADIEYMAWVQDAPTLPVAFRQLQGINLKDKSQCINEVFPCLRSGKSVIDYFLSHVVFPKEMKEFPKKLSSSGWDMGQSKKAYGGAEQKHTNALVLEHILQPSNGVILMPPAKNVTLSDAERLLTLAMDLDPPVQVILDVGAQILEMDNLQVAKTWLKMHDSEKEAAVFVNDDDEICVVDRNGRVEVLRTSSYATRLGSCLIFLGEAHTRGIDLKLPATYRALLTLGAGLTKDRTTQAAMRMRRLGQGQTIVFCIPQEIQSKICELTSKSGPKSITLADVLLWTISETHKEIRRCMPLWQVQGERFCRQASLWGERQENQDMSQDLAERFQEDEAQSIEQRYRARQAQSQPTHLRDSSDGRLRLIAQRCEEHDDLNLNASTLQEEQERELSPEIEQERQVQRPHAAEPAKHTLHKDVIAFAKQGTYSSTSSAYMPAFQALIDTSAAKGFQPAQLRKDANLLVSVDFVETIQRSGVSSYISDSFQRSVNWLLSTKTPKGDKIERILIISPFEANQLYPSMSRSKATLHLYKPRSNSGYVPLDRLDFHTVPIQSVPIVPRSLAVQLNLFAGQLYISSYEDYLEICKFLGLSTRAVTEGMAGWQQDATGFILGDDQGRRGGESGLEKSPVNFMKVLMAKIRKNGESIAKTQMGELLEGKLFQQSDFE
ncbi:hypothetical protein CBER1_08454 [Cercospora berteroae]|uniref:ubiquitinyl hydrolase 1 n=1 Tax=Cercospora berteroae TaxID=357750 RepID=A0A2S6CBQ6_9PEZI|nr:hypothetical protein CBER1_08454 [Cercospora berteroae]